MTRGSTQVDDSCGRQGGWLSAICRWGGTPPKKGVTDAPPLFSLRSPAAI